MRITNTVNNINFQRKFTSSEKREVNSLHSQIKNLLQVNGDKILILHDTSLPFNKDKDVGCGYLNSKEGLQFIEDAKTYLGITTIELHPQGQYHIRAKNQFCCPYAGSGMSLGSHLINLELLTQKEYRNILTKKDLLEVYKANNAIDKNNFTNFENIIPENSSYQTTLKKAFEKFSTLSENSRLKKEFKRFTAENIDWLEPQGIYTALKKEYNSLSDNWNELDRNLYNTDIDITKRNNRIKELQQSKKNEIEFFKFKQFLADKMLKDAKNKINKKGLKLYGDCLIGWGDQDIFTNPKAFMPNTSIGWGLPALNYETILDENSESAKLLKRKVELCAKRYDGIRFDVSWAYLSPCLYNKQTEVKTHKTMGTDAILRMIEDTVKKVKGNDFDLKNLIHEFEASSEDFQLNAEHKMYTRHRTKVYSMQYMKVDWGHLAAYKECFDANDNTFVIGLGNQDAVPQRNIANLKKIDFQNTPEEEISKILVETFGGDIETLKSKPKVKNDLIKKYKTLLEHKEVQINLLAKKYHVTAEDLSKIPQLFAKYKAAEAFNSPNTMLYFMDLFGAKEVFDAHALNGNKNYRHRIPVNYMEKYINSAIEGFGINMFDIYEKLFIKNGLNTKHPELFRKIQQYKEILLDTKEIPIYKQRTPILIASSSVGLVVTSLILKNLLTKREATNKGHPSFNKSV